MVSRFLLEEVPRIFDKSLSLANDNFTNRFDLRAQREA